jgi:hypothetical protein
MSSRLAEKQRRRQAREAAEREAALRERRARRLRLAAAGALAVILIAGVVALVTTSGGVSDEPLPAGSESTFGPHYAGLQQRRERAGVSTMASPTASIHIHPVLAVWVNDKPIAVPANIGIDPRRPPGDMASLHTHTADGVIHDEGQGNATLGEFFAVWGVPFGRDRLGPYRAGAGKRVQMWVDGKPSGAYGALPLRDGERIVISFGSPSTRPPAA